TTASPTKRTKPSSKPTWEPSASPEGRSITTSTQRTRRNPKLPGWNPALPPWERRAHGPRSDSMSGLPQYLPTPDELVLAPPRAPKKQKPQPKPGFISAQPPQPYLGSIASQPSL